MNNVERAELYRRLAERTPHPKTELEYASTFELLVSVMLSAQATDASVNKATAKLYRIANTPRAMLELGEEGLRQHIKTIGLYNSKAANVIKTSRALIERHGGDVPSDRAALEALPGVGRKTANVVLNSAFGQPTIAVDTHIFRVANRTGLAPGRNPREVEDRLLRVTPAAFLKDAHHLLILQGRYVCKAQRPLCPDCVIADLCDYGHKTAAVGTTRRSRSSMSDSKKKVKNTKIRER